MASVAKRSRQWIVVPPFVGSNPIVRPGSNPFTKTLILINQEKKNDYSSVFELAEC